MKIIRWSFLLTTIIIIALIAIFNILFFDKILKKVIIAAGQTAVGAKVEIDYLKTSFKNCSVTINGFRAADKNNYFKTDSNCIRGLQNHRYQQKKYPHPLKLKI